MASKSLAFVGEGPTDFYVFRAALMAAPGGSKSTATQIQPPLDQIASTSDNGEYGGGWRGVLDWCRAHRSSGDAPLDTVVLANYDVVVIHIDGDMANEGELSDAELRRPCPPAIDTANAIEVYVCGLLGFESSSNPHNVVLMIPCQSTEAWVAASGLVGEIAPDSDLECLDDPAMKLYGRRPRFIRMHGDRARKNTATYRSNESRLTVYWKSITDRCTCAAKFSTRLQSNL